MIKQPLYIKQATKIGELAYTLRNISADDSRPLEDYTQEEVVSEARYVLSLFFEPGHMNNDWLNGDDGDPSEARKQVRDLRKFIKTFSH